MTDLEEQLGATLVAVAEDAPLGSDLAGAARRRHRARRQRRIALAGTAVAVAVIAGGVTLAMGGDGGRQQVARDPTKSITAHVAPGWRTVTVENIAVDVPESWQALVCPLQGFRIGPPGTTCTGGPSLTVFIEATVDRALGPNQIVDGTGWVLVDKFAVGATTDSDQLTRRILSTARLAPQRGEPIGGATASGETWTFEHDGVTVAALSSWFAKDCGGLVQVTSRVDCRPPAATEGIRFLDARSFQPRMGEGVVVEERDGATVLWGGYVLRGDYAVFVTHPDKETAQRLLDLIH